MCRPQSLKRIVTAVVLFSLCTTFVISSDIRVRAGQTLLGAQTLKISPDLQQLIQSGNGNKQVKLIVQSKSTGLLGSLLQTIGGTLNAVLSNLNISIINVTASSANILAADSNVTYVSLDAPVRSSGHVTTTTGVQQVRAQKNSATLDGSGVTIAILDSGIDSKHKSFATPGKIKFSKDFTGENRTDDPWGHEHTWLRLRLEMVRPLVV